MIVECSTSHVCSVVNKLYADVCLDDAGASRCTDIILLVLRRKF